MMVAVKTARGLAAADLGAAIGIVGGILMAYWGLFIHPFLFGKTVIAAGEMLEPDGHSRTRFSISNSSITEK